MSGMPHQIKVAGTTIRIWQTGSGSKILFVLPGYLQKPETWTSWLSRLPGGWSAVMIGMPGSISEIDPGHPEWNESTWVDLVRLLRTRYRPSVESWLGYSLGGRLLLYLAGIPHIGIHRVMLMSPDGLAPSLGERLFLYHRLGQRPLKWMIERPEMARRLVHVFRRIGLIDQSGHHFLIRQLRNIPSLETGYHVVRIYTQAQPSRRRLRKANTVQKITVYAIWGESDKVRPISQSRSLWKFFETVHLSAVPGGHTWPAVYPHLLEKWLMEGLKQ